MTSAHLKHWGSIILPAVLFMLAHRLLAAVFSSGVVSSCMLTPIIVLWYYKAEGADAAFQPSAVHLGIVPFLHIFAIVLGTALTSSFILVLVKGNSYGTASAAQIFAIAIAGPINEELIYRGVIFRRGQSFLKTVPALLLSSILFGVAHTGILEAGISVIVGLLFGLIFLRYRSLTAPILAHVGVNLLSFCDIMYHLPQSIYILGIFVLIISIGILIAEIPKSN